MDDLFSSRVGDILDGVAPLATRMRPKTLDDVVGQAALLGEGSVFRKVVESGRLISMILWGPPGTGKTTLARVIAHHTEAEFETLSATSAGVKDLREVLGRARQRLADSERRTVLFIDEIHRFSKNQQDALLPGVEDGTVVFIGATTENPFFEVNSPLISRSTLFRLESLAPDDLEDLIDRALADSDRGLGHLGVVIDPEARRALAERTGGDARVTLNALEMAATLTDEGTIQPGDAEEALQRRIVRYDKAGDNHYDVISAFIKSLRGSDPDAAAYWLHLMLEAGEDPEFIARRMIVFASEDVGLADNRALGVAVDAAAALAHVGLPEAAFALTHAALYLATAPKSNSVTSTMGAARRLVTDGPAPQVPPHLRDGHYRGAATLGHGVGYVYPHDHPGHIVEQQHWPEGQAPQILYRPSRQGAELSRAEWFAEMEKLAGRAPRPSEGASG